MRVGIDLGTTNSAIAYVDKYGNPHMIADNDGNRTMPSVVLFKDDGEAIVGEVAKYLAILNPQDSVQFIKRYMGKKEGRYILNGREITAEGVSAIILKQMISYAQEYLGEQITEAVVTVPADFNDNERKATIDACKIAGIKLNTIINEPTAAALAYGISRSDINQNIVVYDLGGGTFDATVLSIKDENIEIKSSLGDKHLGGVDFENQIIKHVMKLFQSKFNQKLYVDNKAMQELRRKAEECKKILSRVDSSKISITSRGNTLDVEITRKQFEYMISGMVNKTIKIMNRAIQDANFTWDEIDKILLVGGSTRVKMISDEILKQTNIRPSRDINPDEAVALGAAIHANLDLVQKNIKVKDVSSRSLGIVWYDQKNDIVRNKVVIEKNTEIPCKKNVLFRTKVDNQEEYTLKISEGEGSTINEIDIIARATIKLNPRPKGSPISIFLECDENSMVKIKVIDKTDNTILDQIKIDRKGNMSHLEIQKNIEELDKFSSNN